MNKRSVIIKKQEYTPSPIDVSDVQLPEELKKLSELLAKNVHETWSEARMKEGWRFGPERNDAAKEHPCLIPFEELPDSEKAYDRITAEGTLKLILSLGFKITK